MSPSCRLSRVPGAFLALSLLCGLVVAQRPPAWAATKLPGLDTTRLLQLGKLVIYQGNTEVRVFSAFTRRWQVLPVSGSATVRHTNDWLLVQDGTRWTAFSAFEGSFETITVSNAAKVLNPVGNKNDEILLVQDGTSIHAFSGLVGKWTKQFASAQATVSVQRQVAVLIDGSQAFGMAALIGTWVPQGLASTPLYANADSSTAVVGTAGDLYGFSAQTGAWTSRKSLGTGATRRFFADVAVWTLGPVSLAYSGLTGRFAIATTGASPTVHVDRQLAIVAGGGDLSFYSAPLSTWTVLPKAGAATLATGPVTALASLAGRVHAFSALTGKVTTSPFVSSSEAVSSSVAAAVESGTGRAWLYSAFLDRWTAAPTGAKTGLPQLALQSGLVDMTPAGYVAFSGRTGKFVNLATGTTSAAWINSQSSVIAVTEPKMLHVFEPRRDVWLSTKTEAGSLQPTIWRTTLVGDDGKYGYGFGAQSGVIEVTALPQPVGSSKASSEVGRLVTKDWVLGFSSLPDLTSQWQFPEFRRIFTVGTTYQLDLGARSGAAAVLAFGRPVTNAVAIAGLGSLVIDLSTVATVGVGRVGTNGRLGVRIPVPNVPALRGAELFFQSVVLPAMGAPYLSMAASLMVR